MTMVGYIAENGYLGWPEVVLFGAIIVTAAAHHIPKPQT